MLFQNIHPFGRYVRFMSIAKGQEYPSFVPYDARLFLCIGGKAVIVADGTKYLMERGSCIVINSSVPYNLQSTEKEALYFAVNFDFTFDNSHLTTPIPPSPIQTFESTSLINHTTFDDAPLFNRVVFLNGVSHLEQKCIMAEREYSRRMIFSDGIVSGLLSEILFECARAVNSAEQDTACNVEKVLDYIHANFNKPLTNKYVGDVFSFHPNYINEMVKRTTGTSLHKYLLGVRIARAIDLLEESNDSISEIAESCGFQNIYYFSRYFKKTVGVSPTEYRRK